MGVGIKTSQDGKARTNSDQRQKFSSPLSQLEAEWDDDNAIDIAINFAVKKEHTDMENTTASQFLDNQVLVNSNDTNFNGIKDNPPDINGNATYHCNICSFISESKKSFKNHNKRNIHSAKIYQCIYPTCKYKSMFKKTLLAHIGNIHEQFGDKLSCELCDYKVSAANKSNYKRHIKIVHLNVKESKCPQCEYSTSNRADIDKHVKSVHLKIKDFHCSSCTYKTSFQCVLNRHEKAVHNRVKDIKCPYAECTYTATLSKYLSRHIKNVHEPELKKFACFECDFRSIEQKMLERHVANVHRGVKEFECLKCDYKTSSKYVLEKHVKVSHEGIRDYRCSNCDYETSEKSALSNHVKAVHLKVADFECSYCERKFSIKNSLKTHVEQIHLNIKPKVCSYDNCRYKTLKKTRLEEHNEMCHLAKMVVCPECGFETKDNIMLSMHYEAYHPELKIHICSKCKFCTKFDKSSIKHMKTCHPQTEQPLKMLLPLKSCNKCSFQTRKRGMLKEHKRNIHSRVKKECKVHSCLHCNLTFNKNSTLINHTKKEHWEKLGRQNICCSYCDFKAGFDSVMKDHFKKIHNMSYVKEDSKSVRQSWITQTLQGFNIDLDLKESHVEMIPKKESCK